MTNRKVTTNPGSKHHLYTKARTTKLVCRIFPSVVYRYMLLSQVDVLDMYKYYLLYISNTSTCDSSRIQLKTALITLSSNMIKIVLMNVWTWRNFARDLCTLFTADQ